MQLIIQINLYCLIPDSHKKTKTNNNRIAMKKFQRFCTLFLLMIGLCSFALHAQSYAGLWRQVEQAQKKSLPQTVVKLTEKIYRKAELEKNAPQMLKAYICREAYQERLTPDSLYTNLKKLESWVESEKNLVNKAILHSLLAREYSDYMRHNRRQLSDRTALDVDEAPADIREWSTNLFVAKVDEHNLASLKDSVRLLEVSSKEYVPFVELEDGSRFYGHDMYHLLAARAVDTYQLLDGFQVDTLQRARINSVYINMINAYRHRVGAEDAVVLATLDYWKWKSTGGGISREPYTTYRERKERLDKEHLEVLDNLIRNMAVVRFARKFTLIKPVGFAVWERLIWMRFCRYAMKE